MLTFIQLALIANWLFCLRETVAYYIVYILCASAGMLALYDKNMGGRLNCRERLLISTFGVLFSLMALLGNYRVFANLEPAYLKHFQTALSFFGGFAVGYHVLMAVYVRVKNGSTAVSARPAVGARRVFFGTFALCIVIYGLFWYFVAWPANMTPDSINQVTQILTGEYTNNNPYWHTALLRLCYTIGNALFHEINAAFSVYALVQMILMALCFAFAVGTLYEVGIPRVFIVFFACVYVLSPYNRSFSLMVWKDPLFGASLLVILTALLRIFREIGHRGRNFVILALGCFAFCLVRNNGWGTLFTVLVFALALLRKGNRKILIVMAAALAVTAVMKWPMLDALGVKRMDFTEALTLPVQQIARVLAERRPLTEDERELIAHAVRDIDAVPYEYDPRTSDPVRADMRAAGTEYLAQHLGDYARLWIQLGLKYPKEYIWAWIDTTVGYWNAGYAYWMFQTSIEANDFGLSQPVRSKALERLYATYDTYYFGVPLLKPLFSIGLHAWATILCFFLLRLRRDREEMLLAIAPLIVWLSLCVGAPVFSEFRYAYPIFTCLPIVMASAVFPQSRKA